MKAKRPRPVIIKKYENRRLYNTLTSQYINQEQVAQLVRDGEDVRVIDVSTGEDITRLILAQIVLEDAKTPDSMFPLDVLRQMIVASGTATRENALRYFNAMMEMYQNAYRALPAPLNPLEFLPSLLVAKTTRASSPASGKPPAEGGEPASDAADRPGETARSENDDLRRRIEELEATLDRQQRVSGIRRRKSRRKS